MMSWFDQLPDDVRVIGRLVLAMLLAATIGWQREAAQRAAGLRTHMLIGLSACLFVSLGEPLIHHYDDVTPASGASDPMRFDPLRLIEAVVAGVSFLGAGAIFMAKDRQVRGLTTAAGIWTTAAMGVAIALERYVLGIGTTLLCLAVLLLERWVDSPKGHERNAESEDH